MYPSGINKIIFAILWGLLHFATVPFLYCIDRDAMDMIPCFWNDFHRKG